MLANILTLLTGTAPQALGASGSTYGLLGAVGAFYVVNQKILGDKSSQGALCSFSAFAWILFTGHVTTLVCEKSLPCKECGAVS